MRKEKNWLKEKVQKRIDKLPRTYSGLYIDGSRDAYHLALKDINQLDEPEKVVIPKVVADWIEEKLPKSSTGTNTIEDKFYIISRLGYGNGLNTDALYQGRDYEFNNKLNRDLVKYVSINKVKVIRALIDGYEVEKEKKYYVLDSEDIPLLERANNQTCKTTTALSIYEDGRDNSRFALTEKEIKDYDERFWHFSELVEEVTE